MSVKKQEAKFYTDENGQISFVGERQRVPHPKKLYRYFGNVWGARDEIYPEQEIFTYAKSIHQAKSNIIWQLSKKLYIRRRDVFIDVSKIKEMIVNE